jgi:Tfp pilus assembly protein PilO
VARVSSTTLNRRVFEEHRRAILPLAAALALNVAAYALLVYPLSQRVANVAQRNAAAEQALTAARADYAQASGTVTGKTRASQELNTFYTKVLPPDFAGARRLTHLRLAQLARQSNLQLDHVNYEPDEKRKGSLSRVSITMELAGTYPAMRTFIHQLETSPEFVVIDNVELSEEAEGESLLKVRLQLSTYYRNAAS